MRRRVVRDRVPAPAIRLRTRSHSDATPWGSRLRKYATCVDPEDVLPEQTSDDMDHGDTRDEANHDSWLREQIPPHHGD